MAAKFATNASGAIWWPNLQLMQVTESISGSVVPLAMFSLNMEEYWLSSHKEELRGTSSVQVQVPYEMLSKVHTCLNKTFWNLLTVQFCPGLAI